MINSETKTFRQKMADIARSEAGKSQAKFGDIMTIQSEIFKLCLRDPEFMAKGLMLARKAINREETLR